MKLFKHFCSLLNGANYWIKATGYFHNESAGKVIFIEGEEIATSANSAGKVLVTTAAAHGLLVGDVVYLVGHRNTAAPAVADLLGGVPYPVLTVPTPTTLTIDAAFTAAGARGIIGRPLPHLLRDTNLEGIMRSKYEDLPQDDVG